MSKKRLTTDPVCGGETEALVSCPVCGFECTHIQAVAVKQGTRVDLITATENIQRIDDNAHVSERGSIVRIAMFCESGHLFNVCLAFHKGTTSIYTESEPEEEETPQTEELWRD